MKCSIIRRVSTEEQAKKMSLSKQLEFCTDSINNRHWTFVHDFNFENTHGYEIINHPLYLDFKKHVQQRQCDVVMLAMIDRALRDSDLWRDLCRTLQNNHVLLATPSQIYDPQNIDDEFTLNIHSAVGHRERKLIKKRTQVGRDGAKDKGKWLGGRTPFGYKYIPGDKEKPIHIVPEQAKTIRRILDLKTKYAKTEICEIFNNEGTFTKEGYRWTPRILRRVIEKHRLRFYAGLRLDKDGNEIDAIWDQVITKDEYYDYITKLKTRRSWLDNPKHLLTGLDILKCGYCGYSVRTATNRRTKYSVHYYYCSSHYTYKDCKKSKCIKMNTVDPLVIRDIILRLQKSNIIKEGLKEIENRKNDNTIRNDFVARLNTLYNKRENLIKAIEDKLLEYDEIKTRLTTIKAEINTIESKIKKMDSEIEFIDMRTIEPFKKVINKISDFELKDKRNLISILINKIKLYGTYITIDYNFPISPSGSNTIRLNFY